MKLIVITGKKRVGKDTVAKFILKYLEDNNYTANIFSLSHKLKLTLFDVFRMMKARNPKLAFSNRKDNVKVYGKPVRYWLQQFGTNISRKHFGKDIWTKLLCETMNKKNPDYAIISDIRFQDEIDYLKNHYSVVEIIKIVRDQRYNDESENHESENQQISHDYIINNTGYTLRRLKNEIIKIMPIILNKKQPNDDQIFKKIQDLVATAIMTNDNLEQMKLKFAQFFSDKFTEFCTMENDKLNETFPMYLFDQLFSKFNFSFDDVADVDHLTC